ncbi:MAG: glycosyltransferase family 2 protein [Gemmatimonadaceae bacterium]
MMRFAPNETHSATAQEFYVVVPFHNEKRALPGTLRALAAQSDQAFSLVLVDNASSDSSGDVGREFAQTVPFPVEVIVEPEKGTGAASDTGFRRAIQRGARWIARTDADCLPHCDWVRILKRAFVRDGLEFVAGKIRPREDEALTLADRLIILMMLFVAERYGRLHRRGPQFRYPYFMAAGNNLAITASLYEASGGFPRTRIEEMHEDRALSEKVRTLTDRAAVISDAIVYNSARRVRAYGYLNTLRWYRNHGYRPQVVDVR